MTNEFTIQALSPEHLREHMGAYIAVSADVSHWTAENFLQDRPGKWDLSFSFWNDAPIAYCIMSRAKDSIHINQFMVAPAFRCRGIGTTMLEEAVRRGATTLKVNNKNGAAIRFYRKHGFSVDADENGYLLMKSAKNVKPTP